MKKYTVNEGRAPLILSRGTGWRWAVNCTPRTLYPSTHWTAGCV